MRHNGREAFSYATPTLGGRRQQQGSVYIIALLTLVVLGTLAGVLGWSALVQSQRAYERETRLRLESLCQSGINYANWVRRVKKRALPFTQTLRLQEGTVRVQVQPAPQFGNNAFRVISTATYKDRTLTRTRILEGKDKPRQSTEFALYLDEDLDLPPTAQLNIIGDVHANGSIRALAGGRIHVDGAITSGQNIVGTHTFSTYSEQFRNLIPPNLPSMPLLRLHATQLINTNMDLPFGLSLANGTIYYVAGNMTLKGSLRGQAIVVVEGNLTITGATQYADEDSFYIFIVDGNVSLPANIGLDGLLIVPGGNVIAGTNSSVFGGILIQNGNLVVPGTFEIRHDSRINTGMFRRLFDFAVTLSLIP